MRLISAYILPCFLQWASEGLWGPAGIDGKAPGGSSPSGGSMGVWDEALKNQSSLRSGIGLKNSRSSPSLRYYTHSHISTTRWAGSYSTYHYWIIPWKAFLINFSH